MARKPLRPTEADRAAIVTVADLAASWCGEPRLALAVATLRGFVAGSRTQGDLERSRIDVIGALGEPQSRPAPWAGPLPTARVAVFEARDAFCLAASLATVAPMDPKAWAPYERALLAHVESAGALSGLHNARDLVRDAWRGADSPDVPKHSPDHARLILRGQMLRALRERLLLTAEELATAASRHGGRVTAAMVTRAENGTATSASARDVRLLLAVGQAPDAFDAIEETAWAFAKSLAERAAGTSGDRWFAELAARHGEERARWFTGVAAITSLMHAPAVGRLER